jgi:NADPH:quinone reductase-like Zn-dependent oxidoreductase
MTVFLASTGSTSRTSPSPWPARARWWRGSRPARSPRGAAGAADRINTVVDYRGAKEKGVKSCGTTEAGGSPALAELAALAALGDLHIPSAATYPLTAVRDAYQALADRKTHGRIVLHPQELA